MTGQHYPIPGKVLNLNFMTQFWSLCWGQRLFESFRKTCFKLRFLKSCTIRRTWLLKPFLILELRACVYFFCTNWSHVLQICRNVCFVIFAMHPVQMHCRHALNSRSLRSHKKIILLSASENNTINPEETTDRLSGYELTLGALQVRFHWLQFFLVFCCFFHNPQFLPKGTNVWNGQIRAPSKNTWMAAQPRRWFAALFFPNKKNSNSKSDTFSHTQPATLHLIVTFWSKSFTFFLWVVTALSILQVLAPNTEFLAPRLQIETGWWQCVDAWSNKALCPQ